MNNYIKSIILSYGSVVLSAILGLITVPLSLNYFGKSYYGIFSITNDTLAYLSLLGLGLPSATAIIFAKLTTHKEQRQLLSRALLTLGVLSVIGLSILVCVHAFIPNWIYFISQIDSNTARVAKIFIGISIIFLMVKLPFSIFTQLLVYMNKVYLAKMVEILANLLIFLSLIITIYLRLSMVDYAIISGALSLVPLFLSAFLFFKAWFINVTYETKDANELMSYRYLISSGFYIFLSGIGGMVLWSTDSLIISHYLGLNDVAEYAVLLKVFSILFLIIVQLINVVNPLYPKFIRENKEELLKILYNSTTKLFPVVGGVIFILIFGFFRDFIVLWTHNSNIFIGYLSCFLMGIYCYFLCYSIVSSSAMTALNVSKTLYKLILCEAVINLSLSILLVQHIGVAGVVLGSLVAHVVVMLFGAPYRLNKLFPHIFAFDYRYLLLHIVIIMIPSALIVYMLNSFCGGYIKLLLLCVLILIYLTANYYLIGKNLLTEIYGLIRRGK